MFTILALVCVIISAVIAGLDAKPFIWPPLEWLVAGVVFAVLAGSGDWRPWNRNAPQA